MRTFPIDFPQFLIASLAIGYITWVVYDAKVNWRIRRLIKQFTVCDNRFLERVAGYCTEMLACPFCVGFWVTVVVQTVMRFDAFERGLLGVLLTIPAFTVVGAFVARSVKHVTRSEEEAE